MLRKLPPTHSPHNLHARLTAVIQERLVHLNIQHADPLTDLATQAGISLRSSYKRLPAIAHAAALPSWIV